MVDAPQFAEWGVDYLKVGLSQPCVTAALLSGSMADSQDLKESRGIDSKSTLP